MTATDTQPQITTRVGEPHADLMLQDFTSHHQFSRRPRRPECPSCEHNTGAACAVWNIPAHCLTDDLGTCWAICPRKSAPRVID